MLGMSLSRNEAMNYLKEILDICRDDCSPEKISLEETKEQFIVRLKGADLSEQTIKDIARKHCYTVKEENGEFVIFKQKQEA